MAARTVRDREAPGSNPGPPTKIRIRSRRHGWCREGAVSQPYHHFQKDATVGDVAKRPGRVRVSATRTSATTLAGSDYLGRQLPRDSKSPLKTVEEGLKKIHPLLRCLKVDIMAGIRNRLVLAPYLFRHLS